MIKERRGVTSIAVAGASALALAALLGATGAQAAPPPPAVGPAYDATNSNFWLHPPDDWWRSGESEAQHELDPIRGTTGRWI